MTKPSDLKQRIATSKEVVIAAEGLPRDESESVKISPESDDDKTVFIDTTKPGQPVEDEPKEKEEDPDPTEEPNEKKLGQVMITPQKSSDIDSDDELWAALKNPDNPIGVVKSEIRRL